MTVVSSSAASVVCSISLGLAGPLVAKSSTASVVVLNDDGRVITARRVSKICSYTSRSMAAPSCVYYYFSVLVFFSQFQNCFSPDIIGDNFVNINYQLPSLICFAMAFRGTQLKAA